MYWRPIEPQCPSHSFITRPPPTTIVPICHPWTRFSSSLSADTFCLLTERSLPVIWEPLTLGQGLKRLWLWKWLVWTLKWTPSHFITFQEAVLSVKMTNIHSLHLWTIYLVTCMDSFPQAFTVLCAWLLLTSVLSSLVSSLGQPSGLPLGCFIIKPLFWSP